MLDGKDSEPDFMKAARAHADEIFGKRGTTIDRNNAIQDFIAGARWRERNVSKKKLKKATAASRAKGQE